MAMKGEEAYVLAKNHADQVALGIASMTVSGTTVTFVTTGGTTASVTLPTPADGLSVTSAEMVNNHLILHMSDNSTIDAGEVAGTVDQTLTKSGQAADAKVTGDKFNALTASVATNTTNIATNAANIVVNKNDIATLRTDVDDLKDDLDAEVLRATTEESDLQTQIDLLQGKQQFLGSTDCASGSEQSVLSAYAKTITGDSTRPRAGDTITILTDGSGNSRNEQWTYTEITDSTGTVINRYWVMSYGPPIVTKATTTDLGVVKVPANGGVLVDANGAITATKNSIGLGNVDNVKQYSASNPAPISIKLDGTTYTGDTKNGVTMNAGAVSYNRTQSLTSAQKKLAQANIGIDGVIPTKTSDLVNDSNFVVDANYVHTDNNFTTALKNQITDNATDIADIKVEQQEQNEEIANLKKKSFWVGSIDDWTDSDITNKDSDLNAKVKAVLGTAPAEGYQVSVLKYGAVYQYSEASKTWEIFVENADLQIASASQLGVVKVGDGLAIDTDGTLSVDGDIDTAQSDWNEGNVMSSSYVRNRTHYDTDFEYTYSDSFFTIDKIESNYVYVRGSLFTDTGRYYFIKVGDSIDLDTYLSSTKSYVITTQGTKFYGYQCRKYSYNEGGAVVKIIHSNDTEVFYVSEGSFDPHVSGGVGITLPEGVWIRIYMGYSESSGWSTNYWVNKIYIADGGVKKIDSKYLPDGYGGDISAYEGRWFTSQTSRDTYLSQITTNASDIADIQTEQSTQNDEIEALKKKSRWIGSITDFTDSDESNKDADLNAYVLTKTGAAAAEGYQVSVLDRHEIYQFAETSGTWEVVVTNSDLQIASKTQLGVVQIGDGLSVSSKGVVSVDSQGEIERAQSDFTENDPTSMSFIKNKPFGDVPIINVSHDTTVPAGGTAYEFTDSSRTFYWIGDDFTSVADVTANIGDVVFKVSDGSDLYEARASVYSTVSDNITRYICDTDTVTYHFAIVDADEKTDDTVTLHRGVYASVTNGNFVNRIYSTTTVALPVATINGTEVTDIDIYAPTESGEYTAPVASITPAVYNVALSQGENNAPLWKNIVDLVYPVGSIYMSVNNTNPAYLFGGTWVQWGGGRIPIGRRTNTFAENGITFDFRTAESTGGIYTKKLKAAEMPEHYHYYVGPNDKTGNPDGSSDSSSTRYCYWRGNYSDSRNVRTYSAGGNSGSGSSTRQEANDGNPMNWMPAYIVCSMWKRTS